VVTRRAWGIRSDTPWPVPVPATSFGSAERAGRPVAPSGSVGDSMRTARSGAELVPAVGAGPAAAAGRTTPDAAPAGSPPVHRPAAASAVTTASTATPPDAAPSPVQSGQEHHHHDPPSTPDDGHRRWEHR